MKLTRGVASGLRWVNALLGLGLITGAAMAASAPDWLQPYLAEAAAKWRSQDAVVRLLDYEVITFKTIDQTQTVARGALRINTEGGADRCLTSLPYNADSMRITDARAWFIAPDGKVERVSRSAFVDVATSLNGKLWNASRVITYSAAARAEPGCVLAWEISCEAPGGVLDRQFSFDARTSLYHSYFEAIPPAGAQMVWHNHGDRFGEPKPGEKPGSLVWELRQQRASSGGKPTGFIAAKNHVAVRCVTPGAPDRTWPALARFIAEIVEPRAVASPEVKAKTEALVAGRDGRWERIRALTEFVQKDIAYLSLTLDSDYLAGFRPHAADEVLRNRFGDCKDKSALLAAMVRAIGDSAQVLLVTSGDPTAVCVDWPMTYFNHAIVAFPWDEAVPAWWPVAEFPPLGKFVVFDPTDAIGPLGTLNPGTIGGYALLLKDENGALGRLPWAAQEHCGLRSTTTVKLTPEGAAALTRESRRLGLYAVAMQAGRQNKSDQNFAKNLERNLHDAMPLMRDLKWSDTWEAKEASHTLRYSCASPQFARPAGKNLWLIEAPFHVGAASTAPWKTAAPGQSLQALENEEEELRLELPPGDSVAELPSAYRGEKRGASVSLEYRAEAGAVLVRSKLFFPAMLLDKAAYDELHDLRVKFRQAQRRLIVVKLAAPATPAPAN